MPRTRRTVPFGSSRDAAPGSLRREGMAAIAGVLTRQPPRAGTSRHLPATPDGGGLFRRSVSAPADEFVRSLHLGCPLGGVLRLRVVANGGAHQRGRRPAGGDR